MYHCQYFILFESIFILLYQIKSKVDLTSLLNAIVTTIGGHYYIFYRFEDLKNMNITENSDLEERNERLIILSVFMMAYGVIHLYDSIRLRRKDYIFHSIMLLLVNIIPYYNNICSNIAYFMALETSTIFLCLMKLNNFKIKAMFFITFCLYRLGLFPLYSFLFIKKHFNNREYTYMFFKICMILLNTLNCMWGVKIIKIALRELGPKLKQE